jgi:tetratricopeptide (TPR) repeat protein
LIRETTYESITPSRRRELHRRAAEWLKERDLVLRAEHLLLAGDPRAGDAFWRAGKEQLERFRYTEALDLSERGLLSRGEQGDRFKLMQLKGRTLLAMGLPGSAANMLQQAIDATEQDAQRADVWLLLAKSHIALDRYDDALHSLDLAEQAARVSAQNWQLAEVHRLRGNVHFPLGQVDKCHDEQAQALSYARSAGCMETEAGALSGLGDAEYARGRMLSANRRFRECVDMANKNGWPRVAAENQHMVASTAHYFSSLQEARSQGRLALDLAKEIAHRRAELCCHSFLSVISFDLGEWELVESSIQQAQSLMQQLGARRFEPLNLTFLANTNPQND